MCRIRYKDKDGKRGTKNVTCDMHKGMTVINSANQPATTGGIQVSYRRYSTMIYPQVKG